eukprot:937801-Rhodomonas_salina.1
MRCPVLTLHMILRIGYAVSGTDVGYPRAIRPMGLRICYAMSGTEVGYAHTRRLTGGSEGEISVLFGAQVSTDLRRCVSTGHRVASA